MSFIELAGVGLGHGAYKDRLLDVLLHNERGKRKQTYTINVLMTCGCNYYTDVHWLQTTEISVFMDITFSSTKMVYLKIYE